MSDQVGIKYHVFVSEKKKFYLWFLRKNDVRSEEIYRNKRFSSKKRRYRPHFLLDYSSKGTVVNRSLLSLHGGSLKTKRTVPLRVRDQT